MERDQATAYQPTTCAVCHDPHGSSNPAQLRFPVSSPDPADNERMIKWTRDYWTAMHPHSAGGAYVNMMMDEGEDRVLRWEERDIVLRASPVGPPLPVLLPLRALQRRADGLVSIRGHARGRGRVAHVEVEVLVRRAGEAEGREARQVRHRAGQCEEAPFPAVQPSAAQAPAQGLARARGEGQKSRLGGRHPHARVAPRGELELAEDLARA